MSEQSRRDDDRRPQFILSSGLVVLLLPACAAIKQSPLPSVAPALPKPFHSGPQAGWPPRAENASNEVLVPWTEIPGALNDRLAVEIQTAALGNSEVRAALGERFAFISIDEVEPEKGRGRVAGAPLLTRITYFSHSRNRAIGVFMRASQVERVAPLEGFPPPEGRDEVKLAVELARGDALIARVAQDLIGEAILISPLRDQPGYGHRVLYVAFSKEDEEHTRYFATVDLTDQKVLQSGVVAGGQRQGERR